MMDLQTLSNVSVVILALVSGGLFGFAIGRTGDNYASGYDHGHEDGYERGFDDALKVTELRDTQE